MSRRPARCGTYTGYQRHRRDGEVACRPCKDAMNVYQRDSRRRFDGHTRNRSWRLTDKGRVALSLGPRPTVETVGVPLKPDGRVDTEASAGVGVRVGSMFSGGGGLDMAVHAGGAAPTWWMRLCTSCPRRLRMSLAGPSSARDLLAADAEGSNGP